MALIGSILVPCLILFVIIYALIKKVNVYDAFVEGAAASFKTLLKVMPYICAMTVGITVFRACGALSVLTRAIGPASGSVGVPPELLPMILLRPFSGGASIAMLNDIFSAYGADSYLGRAASIMLSSSETVFYTIALYFGSVGIKKTRYTVPVTLLAETFGISLSLLLARLFWG